MQSPVEEVNDSARLNLTDSMNIEIDNFITAMNGVDHKDHRQAIGTYFFIRAVVERISKIDNSETLVRFVESQPDEVKLDSNSRMDNLDDDGYDMSAIE